MCIFVAAVPEGAAGNAMYDFDEIIERRGSGCVKHDKAAKGVIPLWVADMDFRTPDFILDAIRGRLDCPVLGYPFIPDDYFPTIARWVKDLHGWDVDPGHICFVPGVIRGIALAERALLGPGGKVIIQPPVYHPFSVQSGKNGMEVLLNPLREIPGTGLHEMDFESLEGCIREGGRMLLLSNPQNPTGQCWSAETLRRLAGITSRAGVTVVSDEVHGEMAHRGARHTPYASVSPEAARNSITLMAPTKTFNMAGVTSSYAIIPDGELRRRFFGFMDATQLDYPPIFSIEATRAAYLKGRAWRREMLHYVEGNIAYTCRFLETNIPEIRAHPPQASFLMWLDCRALGLSRKDLMYLMKARAKILPCDGTLFGPGGEGFVRLNVGCPRSVLEEALSRLLHAVEETRT